MSSTDWIAQLKVAELKEELKKRGQPVSGKKAELAERLEAYVKANEVGWGTCQLVGAAGQARVQKKGACWGACCIVWEVQS